MFKRLGFITLILMIGVVAFWFVTNRAQPAPQTTLSLAADIDTSGFARAYEPILLEFPKDHGPHFDFQTEWWYYTGNLQDSAGNHYGYQLTFFRRGLTPGISAQTDLTTNQIYFAHFAITDVAGKQHTGVERFSRGAGGLAGVQSEPFKVWLEDWSIVSLNDDGSAIHLQALNGDIAIDLTLQASKPLVLHGDRGFSPKTDEPGGASYYVSYTRMNTQGQLKINGQSVSVTGESWFDHEWSTKTLGERGVGWDWFSLQLSDGREIMFFQVRRDDGTLEPPSGGTIIESDGSTRHFNLSDVTLTSSASWQSPTTGALYPAQWHLVIPSAQLDLTLEPLLADQEMLTSFIYWEGAVKITGTSLGNTVTGKGYVELTGYSRSLQGTF